MFLVHHKIAMSNVVDSRKELIESNGHEQWRDRIRVLKREQG